VGNKRFIVKHYRKMNISQRRYHLFKYRLLEWSKNRNRSLKYLIKGLTIYPWWKNIYECKRVLATVKNRINLIRKID
jgi:hypothetical protein